MVKKIMIGIIAGFFSGLFASGGGLILLPASIYFLGLNDKEARATTIFAILPMVLTSTFFYYKNNYINWNNGIKIAIGGTIGGFIGAKLLNKINNKYLKIIFIIFLFSNWEHPLSTYSENPLHMMC